MAAPELIVSYEYGDCEIRIYGLPNGEKRYWIRAGAGLLEFNEEQLVQFLELIYAFVDDEGEENG